MFDYYISANVLMSGTSSDISDRLIVFSLVGLAG